MTTQKSSIRVYFLTLTNTHASEHIYGQELAEALTNQGIQIVNDWREADVIHLFEVNFFTRDTLIAFEIPTLLRILKSDIPVVVSTDDLYFIEDPSLTARPKLYSLNNRTQRWLFRKCDAIIAISNSVKRSLTKTVHSTPIHVVHHGVHDRYFTDPVETADPILLHVSLASKRKNPEAVMEVATHVDIPVIIAGGGWEEYEPVCDDNGIEITGYVPEEELIQLYARASLFYFPTFHEGFGLPLLEAMAAETAVVASNVYAVPEVVGDTGILHPPDDVDAHLRSINCLLADAKKRCELGRAALSRARDFTWARSAERTAEVYQTVMRGI